MSKPPLLVQGHHGLGDNIHQRAVMRQLLQNYEVWLETSWVSVYHDLIAEGLHCVRRPIGLRTQQKNQVREAHLFSAPLAQPAARIRLSYPGHSVARQPSKTVLEAMLSSANMRLRYDIADFRLPIPDGWLARIDEIIERWHAQKPILIYRPLVVRPEWRGGDMRNADPDAYAQIFASIRDQFFVVSVADLVPGREWIAGHPIQADVTMHQGELNFELLAALFARAVMVYTSSGFATVLAQAVSTPNISVIGSYERGTHHAAGAKWAPYLAIEPITPCACAFSGCLRRCSKAIHIPVAIERVTTFVDGVLGIAPPQLERVL